jgi:hypothetical protein
MSLMHPPSLVGLPWMRTFKELQKAENAELHERAKRYLEEIERQMLSERQAPPPDLPQDEITEALINEGLIDRDLKVLTSLNAVAAFIREGMRTNIKAKHLKKYIKHSNGKGYSDSAIRKAVETAN